MPMIVFVGPYADRPIDVTQPSIGSAVFGW
jgi:hypothetical protein